MFVDIKEGKFNKMFEAIKESFQHAGKSYKTINENTKVVFRVHSTARTLAILIVKVSVLPHAANMSTHT